MKPVQTAFFLFFVNGLLAFPFAVSAQPVQVTLDPGKTYQTIVGWEATSPLSDKPAAPPPAFRDILLDRVVDEIGINRIRLEIRSGAETRSRVTQDFIAGRIGYKSWKKQRYMPVNDNNDPFNIDWSGFDFSELDWHIRTTILPLRRRLTDRGGKLLINLNYVSFREGWYFQQDPEEYAELVLATYIHMKENFGFVPDTWEVILEPDKSKGAWGGKTIGRAVAAAAKRLKDNGFEPAFIVPSVLNMNLAAPMIDEIAAVPGAMDAVVEFSYHRYNGNARRALPELVARAEKYGKRTSMLEFWFGRGTPEVLHQDLELGQVSAWQGRVVTGFHDVTNANSSRPILKPKKEIRYNLQYFRYIRPGAVRIAAEADAPLRLDPLAFINTDGTYVVVILAKTASDIVLRGLPSGEYKVSFAVAGGSVMMPDTFKVGEDGILETRIPSAGVITISGI